MENSLQFDELVHVMCLTDRQLERRIHCLRKECDLLQSLLNPWKPLPNKEAKHEYVPADRDAKPQEDPEPKSEYQAEMKSIDKLLEKVKKVRTHVTDQEVKEMCLDNMMVDVKSVANGSSSGSPIPLNDPTEIAFNCSLGQRSTSYKGSQINNCSSSNKSLKPKRSSPVVRSDSKAEFAKTIPKSTPNFPLTCYQTSFKKPPVSKSNYSRLHRSKPNPDAPQDLSSAKSPTHRKNGHALCSSMLHGCEPEEVPIDGDANGQGKSGFLLTKNGQSLIVPKNLSHLLKKAQLLQSKYHLSPVSLPASLDQYYDLCQTV